MISLHIPRNDMHHEMDRSSHKIFTVNGSCQCRSGDDMINPVYPEDLSVCSEICRGDEVGFFIIRS